MIYTEDNIIGVEFMNSNSKYAIVHTITDIVDDKVFFVYYLNDSGLLQKSWFHIEQALVNLNNNHWQVLKPKILINNREFNNKLTNFYNKLNYDINSI